MHIFLMTIKEGLYMYIIIHNTQHHLTLKPEPYIRASADIIASVYIHIEIPFTRYPLLIMS